MHDLLNPPKGASLLLRVFAGEPDFPQVEGDLREEFNQLALTSGPDKARQWYWHEALRNIWAFTMRSGSINVLGTAAVCIALNRLAGRFFFHWVRDSMVSVPRVKGLGLLLNTLFQIIAVLVLGAVSSRILRGREPFLRLAFSGFYLLQVTFFIFTSGIYTWGLQEPVHFVRFLIGLLGVLTSFWLGSRWSERSERLA